MKLDYWVNGVGLTHRATTISDVIKYGVVAKEDGIVVGVVRLTEDGQFSVDGPRLYRDEITSRIDSHLKPLIMGLLVCA